MRQFVDTYKTRSYWLNEWLFCNKYRKKKDIALPLRHIYIQLVKSLLLIYPLFQLVWVSFSSSWRNHIYFICYQVFPFSFLTSAKIFLVGPRSYPKTRRVSKRTSENRTVNWCLPHNHPIKLDASGRRNKHYYNANCSFHYYYYYFPS